MSAPRHTLGPWRAAPSGQIVGGPTRVRQICKIWNTRDREQDLANASLLAAAPDLLGALKSIVENAEQRAFECWLTRTCPSGDCDSVHAQWIESSEFSDFSSEWDLQITAISKATP